MPTSYPIILPSAPTSKTITIRKRSVVASVSSPFDLSDQVQVWSGQRWAAEVSLPPGKRADMEPWVAALTSLNFKEGSFLLGDTANPLPRGSGLSAALIGWAPAILNGGFETAGGGGADVFASWSESVLGTGAIVRDTSVFLDGVASCRLDTNGASNYASVSQTLLTVGKTYSYAFYAKCSTSGKSITVSDGIGNIVIPITTSWVFYSGIFVAQYAVFALYSEALASSVWIDDVTVIQSALYGGLVNGGSQTGAILTTDGWRASVAQILKNGDWLQLGGTNLLLNSHLVTNSETGVATNSNATDVFGTASKAATVATFLSGRVYKDISPVMRGPFVASVYIKPSVDLSGAYLAAYSNFDIDVQINSAIRCPAGVWTRLVLTVLGDYSSINRLAVFPGGACDLTIGSWQISPTLESYVATTSINVCTARLYKIADTVSSDPSGNVLIPIWPNLRSSPADNAPIKVVSPQGKFMLSAEHEWSIDDAHVYGLNFSAQEDLRP